MEVKERSKEYNDGFRAGFYKAQEQHNLQTSIAVRKSVYEEQREREERVVKCVLSGVAAYIVVGFLVFGWYHNHYPMVCEPVDRGYCDIGSHHAGNIAMSAIWPVRLVGEFAIFVTRWP